MSESQNVVSWLLVFVSCKIYLSVAAKVSFSDRALPFPAPFLRTPEERASALSKKSIAEGGGCQGFVLSNEGGVASQTPWKNIMSMIKAAAEY